MQPVPRLTNGSQRHLSCSRCFPYERADRDSRVTLSRRCVERRTTNGRFAFELTGQQQQRLGVSVVPSANPLESMLWTPPFGSAFWGPPRLKTRPSPGLWQCASPDPKATEQQQQVAKRHGKDSGTIVSLTKAPKSDFLNERMARSSAAGVLRFYVSLRSSTGGVDRPSDAHDDEARQSAMPRLLVALYHYMRMLAYGSLSRS